MRHRAYEEFSRYSVERGVRRSVPEVVQPHSGAALGVFVYVVILLLTAYCAGNATFGADWLSLGSLDAGARGEWWRAVTALTLHLDQEHLLGNVLFGAVAGIAASRLLGPGVAWASILGAAVLANYAEILISPITHRAVGASTAVFAALGIALGHGVAAAAHAARTPVVSLGAAHCGNLSVDVARRRQRACGCAGTCAGISFRAGRWVGLCSKRRSQQSRSARAGHRGFGAVLLVCAAWAFAPAGWHMIQGHIIFESMVEIAIAGSSSCRTVKRRAI